MSLTRFHLVAIGAWFTVVSLTILVRSVMGLPPSLIEGLVAFGVAVAPVLMVLVVFRGAPPQTIAEVLYEAEHNRNPARQQLIAAVKDAK